MRQKKMDKEELKWTRETAETTKNRIDASTPTRLIRRLQFEPAVPPIH
jgi:hypothetical protein